MCQITAYQKAILWFLNQIYLCFWKTELKDIRERESMQEIQHGKDNTIVSAS